MFFENMLYPFVELGLVKVTDIDENDFKAFDTSESLLGKLDIKHVQCLCF